MYVDHICSVGVMAYCLFDQIFQAFSSQEREVQVLKTKSSFPLHSQALLRLHPKLHNSTRPTCDDYYSIKLKCSRRGTEIMRLTASLTPLSS